MSAPILEIAHFVRQLPLQGRLMAVDVGKKNVGVAISDESRMIASPYKVLTCKGSLKQDIAALVKTAADFHLSGMCFGWPLQLWGEEGERALWVKRFVQEVAVQVSFPLCLWDERWSTKGVERTLLAADMSRRRRAQVVDKVAACYILQGVLDWIRFNPL